MSGGVTEDLEVIWHDLECGGYDEDLPLWRALAAERDGPVLDIGAGTGRVALDLAARGHAVTALDAEPVLLEALTRRARQRGLRVETVLADARELDLGRRFSTVLVPMQTIQLLGGPTGRAALLRRVHAHLAPGGVFAAALADALEAFDEEHTEPPLPDIREIAGTVFASRPVALREREDGVAIERLREVVDPAGHRTFEGNVVVLDRTSAPQIAAEADALGIGWRALPQREIPQTTEHVGSQVVVLGA